jgi:hypothetical protein
MEYPYVKRLRRRPMSHDMSSAALDRRAPYEVRAHHKRCGKCGKLVSRAAFVCRRCGSRQRIKPRTILLVLSACLVAAMFAVAGAGGLFAHANPPETAAGPHRPMAAMPEDLVPPDATGARPIAAAELWMAYVRDQVAANRQFKDRLLLVSGTVRSVERDFEGRPMVRLTTGDAYDSVNAKMATRRDLTSAGVRKGDAVTLLCVGRGSLIGSPQLTGCFLR